MSRCQTFCADVARARKQIENDREITEQIKQIELDHFSEVASVQLEKADQIEILDLILLFDTAAVKAAGEHFVKVEGLFVFVSVFAEIIAMCHDVFLFWVM
jgi:hypothetical protein